MITLEKINSSKLSNEITDFGPVECLDCDFGGNIPTKYFLVTPGAETEKEFLELKKLVKEQLGFNSFSELGCELGMLISVCRCPECGSEEILLDF